MPLRSRWLSVLVCATAACGTGGAAGPGPDALATPLPTIAGVGILPDTIARESEPPVIIRPPVNEDGTVAELIGQKVSGNRFMMIGDSILAATDRRFGGEMCAALVPLGWVVEVNAEPGRFVEFGNRVLDRRLDADWDAAAVFLGSNYRADQAAYERELREILERLAPRPTLLFTVTVYRPAWAEVNEVVERLAGELDHVVLVDWRTVAETPGVLSADGLHPSEAGAEVLADLTAAQLGRAPVGEGECLRSEFTDSSAINTPTVDAPASSSGPASSGSSGSGSSGSGSSSSVPTTTVRPGPASTTPGSTAPPTTARPTTTAPPSSSPTPPSTSSPPPPTAPPTTSPPTTTSP